MSEYERLTERIGGTTMIDKLKPCPFCGGKPFIDKDKCFDGTFVYQISCVNRECDVSIKTKWRATKKEAIEAWNRRENNNG